MDRTEITITTFLSRKRAITTFLSRKFMITRSSIALKDFLGSSIAPQVMPPWSVAHILDLIVDLNLNSRSGSGDKSGPSRGVNHGATSPSTGRVITPQVGKVELAC